MKHVLVDGYQVCSNKSPRVQIDTALGVIDFRYLFMSGLISPFNKINYCFEPNILEIGH
jgi:hypothetical protein